MTTPDWADEIACELQNLDQDNREERQYVTEQIALTLRAAFLRGRAFEARELARISNLAAMSWRSKNLTRTEKTERLPNPRTPCRRIKWLSLSPRLCPSGQPPLISLGHVLEFPVSGSNQKHGGSPVLRSRGPHPSEPGGGGECVLQRK